MDWSQRVHYSEGPFEREQPLSTVNKQCAFIAEVPLWVLHYVFSDRWIERDGVSVVNEVLCDLPGGMMMMFSYILVQKGGASKQGVV